MPAAEGEDDPEHRIDDRPYALQDFSLFYTLRYGYRPSKIAFLALHA